MKLSEAASARRRGRITHRPAALGRASPASWSPSRSGAGP
jgi:hypothetical protein